MLRGTGALRFGVDTEAEGGEGRESVIHSEGRTDLKHPLQPTERWEEKPGSLAPHGGPAPLLRPNNAFRLPPRAGPPTSDPNLARVREQSATRCSIASRRDPSLGSPGSRDATPGAKFKVPAGTRRRAGALRRSRKAGSSSSGALGGHSGAGPQRGGEKGGAGWIDAQGSRGQWPSWSRRSRVIPVISCRLLPGQEPRAPGIT